jgi:hypothetical protein
MRNLREASGVELERQFGFSAKEEFELGSG